MTDLEMTSALLRKVFFLVVHLRLSYQDLIRSLV